MKLSIAKENNSTEIQQVFTRTFSDSEGEQEGHVIGKLVFNLLSNTPTEDLYCFNATENNEIIGSIIFSILRFENSPRKAYILSPVAVTTRFQKKGIGQALINFGLESLKQDGVELVMTYGDPQYYSKVGFKAITEELVQSPIPLTYPEGWLGQSLVSSKIKPVDGKSHCVEALNNPEYW